MARKPILLLLVACIAVLPACSKRTDASGELKAILRSSLHRPFRFHYSEKRAAGTVKVNGEIADDLRFKDELIVDGKTVASEVVMDDARALRFGDFTTASTLLIRKPGTTRGAVTAASGKVQSVSPVALDLLKQGGWVVDPAGGAALAEVVVVPRRHLGDDPVYDALTVPSYIDTAIAASGLSAAAGANAVVKFNPEDINYNPSLDPFPHPDAGKGETRYDIVPLELGPRDASTGQSQQQLEQSLPRIDYFRRMSVYVRGGVVNRVVENVSVRRRLEEPNNDVLARLADVGVKISPKLSLDEQARQVIKGIGKFLDKDPQVEPIREREMELDLYDIGAAVTVDMPTETVNGNLGGALARGQVLRQRTS